MPAQDDPVAAAQSLSKPEAQAAFKAALTQVLDSMKSLQVAFDDVKGGLPTISESGALQVQWAKIYKQYTDIRWAAKDNSTEVSTYIEQLGTVQLPIASGAMGPIPDDEVVATLTDFREGSQAVGQNAKLQVTNFTNLRTALVDFQTQYQTLYNTQGGQQSSEISSLTKAISDLTFRADQINDKIQKIAMDNQSTFIKRNKWLLAVPVVNLIALMMDMISDSQAKKDLDVLRAEYESVMKQILEKRVALHKAQAASQNLGKYKVTIDALTDSRYKDVLGGLDIFSEVWQAADTDVKELTEYKASGGSKPVPLCLSIFQQTGGSAYTGINAALQGFATGASR